MAEKIWLAPWEKLKTNKEYHVMGGGGGYSMIMFKMMETNHFN